MSNDFRYALFYVCVYFFIRESQYRIATFCKVRILTLVSTYCVGATVPIYAVALYNVEIFGYPNSNVFSALHSMKVLPFSLAFAHDGGRYEIAGKMLLKNVDCLCLGDEYEAEIAGKVMDLTISVLTEAL